MASRYHHSERSNDHESQGDTLPSFEGMVASVSQAIRGNMKVTKTVSNSMTTTSTKRVYLGVQDDTSMSQNLKHLLTFDGYAHVLRASSLTTLMLRSAAILKQSEGSSKTYMLSEVVEHIHFFISHNWAIRRWKKFLALALQFNIPFAVAGYLVTWMALAVCIALKALPVVEASGMAFAVWPQVFCMPAFFLLLFGVRDLLWAFGHRGRHAFLDKTCIHQTDKHLQRLGIQKLGAFLKSSKLFVVLYTDLYLKKLWTVYEVAAFLSLHPSDRMIFVPVTKGLFFICVLVCCYFYRLAATGLEILGHFTFSIQVVGIFLAGTYIFCVRKWGRERKQMHESIPHFSISHCACACEEDRPVVYANIAALMRGSEAVDFRATDAEALATFDELVRSEVFERVLMSSGTRAFSYPQYIMVGLAAAGASLLDGLAMWTVDFSEREALAMTIKQITWTFAGWPFLCCFSEVIGATKLHLEGCRELFWFLLLVVIDTVTAVTLSMITTILMERSPTSDVAMAAQIAVAAISIVLQGLFSRSRLPKKVGAAAERQKSMRLSQLGAHGPPCTRSTSGSDHRAAAPRQAPPADLDFSHGSEGPFDEAAEGQHDVAEVAVPTVVDEVLTEAMRSYV